MLRVPALLLTAAVVSSGCTPSGFLAHQFVRAPRTFPQVVSPAPRVYFSFSQRSIEKFPLQLATLGRPGVTLAYRLVPPADYQPKMVVTRYASQGTARPLYRYQATVPGTPTSFSAQPKGTVVLLHGYGLDQDTLFPWALYLAQAGWQCVLVDLRGHGGSSGDQIYFGIREAVDLEALLSELIRRNQAAGPVNVVGVSYGAAVALRWATTDPRVNAVVAVTPYSHLADAIEGLRNNYAEWLPASLIRNAADKVPAIVGVPDDGLDPQTWLKGQSIRVLFVAATDDPVAPVASVEALAAEVGSRSVLKLPGFSHEQAPFQLEALRGPIAAWLQSVSPGVGGGAMQ